MRKTHPFRIASWPTSSQNPYLKLFYEALARHGIEHVPEFSFSPRWLWNNSDGLDALHFHWPEWLWDSRYDRPVRALVKLAVLLAVARLKGIKVIWTVHNLASHGATGSVDHLARRLLARGADLSILHSQDAHDAYHDLYRPSSTVLKMDHGSYLGYYSTPRAAREVAVDLGLDPDRPIVACVGRLRGYKGLPTACEAVSLLNPKVQLLIAGVPHAGFDVESLRRTVGMLPNVALVDRSVSDHEFSDIVGLSDLVLLPYTQITGSGALLAAWSLGRAVIASDLPYFREMSTSAPGAMWLFPQGDPEALAGIITDALAVPATEREAAAFRVAERYDWRVCVQPVADHIQAWTGGDRSKPAQLATAQGTS